MPEIASVAEWERLARYVTGESSASERVAVERWLAEEPSRRELAAELTTIWGTAELTPAGFDAWAAWRLIDAKLNDRPADLSPARRLPRPARRLAPRAGIGSVWRVAAVIAAVVGAGLLYRAQVGGSRPVSPAPQVAMREFVSPRGRRAEFKLSDGTRVMLGPGSRLRVPLDYGERRRDVHLEGQGYFEVRHDETRPFLVRTATGIAEDLGTRFDVLAYPGDTAMRVVVAEGKVALRTGGEAGTELMAGQLGQLGASGRVVVRTGVALERYFAWTEGKLVFEGTPLRDALPALSRWYDLEFTLSDTSLGGLPLTATFRDQPTPEVFELLALTLGVHQDRRGRVVVLSRP